MTLSITMLCNYPEFHQSVWRFLLIVTLIVILLSVISQNDFILNVDMLNVIMLSVDMLSVVAPHLCIELAQDLALVIY